MEFLRRNKIPLTIVICVVFLAALLLGLLLPSPYNFGYAIDRMTKQPTFQCGDGIYSWAPTPSGACSNHGAIAKKFNPDGTEAEPSFDCVDGTHSYAVTRQGACSGHGGIDEWKVPLRMPKLPKV